MDDERQSDIKMKSVDEIRAAIGLARIAMKTESKEYDKRRLEGVEDALGWVLGIVGLDL